MNAWPSGVAVAAAAMRDSQGAEGELERAGGERGPVVGAERQHPGLDTGGRLLDQRDALGRTAAQLQVPVDDLPGSAVDRGHQVAQVLA